MSFALKPCEKSSTLSLSLYGVKYVHEFLSQCYLIPYWQDDQDPNIVEVQEGFPWPQFIVSKKLLTLAGFSPEHLASPTFRLQIYREELGVWAAVDTDHVVTVREGSRIFMKSASVSLCRGLDHLLQPPTRQPDLRTNLAGERAFIKYMESKTDQRDKCHTNRPLAVISPPPPPPSSHCVLVPLPVPQHSLLPPPRPGPSSSSLSRSSSAVKRRPPVTPKIPLAKRMRHTSTAKSERCQQEIIELSTGSEDEVIVISSDGEAPDDIPQRHIKHEPTVKNEIKEDPSLSMSTPIRQPLKLEDPSTPSFVPLATRYTASLSPEMDMKSWPADYHAVDIINAFVPSKPKQAFRKFFPGVLFKASTFYEHRRRWRSAAQEERDRALMGGHNDAGLWSQFMERNPIKDAVVKAAQRRARCVKSTCHASRSSSGEPLSDGNSEDDSSE